MSWIAEYDTQGREFPTCVHVTKTTGTMTHGATYVPIEDGKAVRAENVKLRKYVAWLEKWALDHASFGLSAEVQFELDMARRELGVEVDV